MRFTQGYIRKQPEEVKAAGGDGVEVMIGVSRRVREMIRAPDSRSRVREEVPTVKVV